MEKQLLSILLIRTKDSTDAKGSVHPIKRVSLNKLGMAERKENVLNQYSKEIAKEMKGRHYKFSSNLQCERYTPGENKRRDFGAYRGLMGKVVRAGVMACALCYPRSPGLWAACKVHILRLKRHPIYPAILTSLAKEPKYVVCLLRKWNYLTQLINSSWRSNREETPVGSPQKVVQSSWSGGGGWSEQAVWVRIVMSELHEWIKKHK